MFLGTDIIEVERIKKKILHLNRDFLEKVFTENEINKIDPVNPDFERASGFWAAKESLVKATGLGYRNGIRFHDAEIHHDEYGAPFFLLSGRLKEVFESKGCSNISLSISHCYTHAVAVTLIY